MFDEWKLRKDRAEMNFSESARVAKDESDRRPVSFGQRYLERAYVMRLTPGACGWNVSMSIADRFGRPVAVEVLPDPTKTKAAWENFMHAEAHAIIDGEEKATNG